MSALPRPSSPTWAPSSASKWMQDGSTMSHVFRGSVRMQLVGEGPEGRRGLAPGRIGERRAGQRRRRVAFGDGEEGRRACRSSPAACTRQPKQLDLLDIVAGGNGTGHLRDHGINPINGVRQVIWNNDYQQSDCRYWSVDWHPLVDGVFVPDGRIGAVRLDSAGHFYDGFPETTGASFGTIWARSAVYNPDRVRQEQRDIGSKPSARPGSSCPREKGCWPCTPTRA